MTALEVGEAKTMTPQQKMQAALQASGIPYKQIECYGSQIMVTAWSRPAAQRWSSLLSKFATVKSVGPGLDDAKVNKGSCLNPSVIKVWRVWAVV